MSNAISAAVLCVVDSGWQAEAISSRTAERQSRTWTLRGTRREMMWEGGGIDDDHAGCGWYATDPRKSSGGR